MESVLLGLAVLACPVGMGLMMWFMAKGMRSGSKTNREAAMSVEELQAERRRLDAEIERVERQRELGARIDSLAPFEARREAAPE